MSRNRISRATRGATGGLSPNPRPEAAFLFDDMGQYPFVNSQSSFHKGGVTGEDMYKLICSTKRTVCALILLCASLAIVSQAQTFTTLANFMPSGPYSPQYVNLVQGR